MSKTIETTVFSFDDFERRGGLFTDMLRARKKAFIEKNGWDLPENFSMEFDQYDTPMSHYVVIRRDGVVVSGVRLTPTTAKVMLYSYMIRDAQKGLLPTLPETLMDILAPVDPLVWEASRTFISDDVPADERHNLRKTYVRGLLDGAHRVGATHLITLMSISWPLYARRYNLSMKPLGQPIDVGTPHQVVMIDIMASEAIAAAKAA